jgi:hypothetical protein
MADAGGRAGQRQPDGTVRLASYEVDERVRDLHESHGEYLTKAMRDDPAQLREAAQEQLVHLGLLRLTPAGGWILSPVAGRYRAPTVVMTANTSGADATSGLDPETGTA